LIKSLRNSKKLNLTSKQISKTQCGIISKSTQTPFLDNKTKLAVVGLNAVIWSHLVCVQELIAKRNFLPKEFLKQYHFKFLHSHGSMRMFKKWTWFQHHKVRRRQRLNQVILVLLAHLSWNLILLLNLHSQVFKKKTQLSQQKLKMWIKLKRSPFLAR
jgi:hypothetical protein